MDKLVCSQIRSSQKREGDSKSPLDKREVKNKSGDGLVQRKEGQRKM